MLGELVAVVVAGSVMAVGLAGTVFPVLPGLGLVWVGAMLYGVLAGFGGLGAALMVVITGLTVAGYSLAVWIPKRRAQAGGAGRPALVWGTVLAIVGFFLVPVVGAVIGFAGGIYLVEYRRHRHRAAAWAATRTTLVGFGLAAAAQLAIGLVMVALWVVWVVAA